MKKALLIAVAALFVAIGANAQVKWQRAMNVKQNRAPMAAHSPLKVADDGSLMKPIKQKTVKRTNGKRAPETVDGTYILESQNWDGDFTESSAFTIVSATGEVALWAPAGVEAEMYSYNVKLTDFTAEGGVAYGTYNAEEGYIEIPAGVILGNSKNDMGAGQDYGDVVFSACVTADGVPQEFGYNMYLIVNEDGTVEIDPGDFSEEITAGELPEGAAITGFYNGCATDDAFNGNGAWNYGFECEVFIPNAILGTTECHTQSGGWTPWANASYPVCVEDYGTEMVVHNFFGLCPISINISGDKASVAVPVRVMESNYGTDENPNYIQIWQWDENFENIINPGEITGNISVENGVMKIEFYDTEYKEAWTDEQGDHEAGNYIITDYTKWFMVHSTYGDSGAYWWGEARNVYLVMADEKYTLTYMVDNEVYKSYYINYGATITPEPAPLKEGCTFSGWSDIPETMPAHDVTVTGSFTINKYKLTYMVDGEEYKTFEVDFGTAITPEDEPTKEGYTFSGWSEIPETMPAHDVTVMGSFTINKYKLTYMIDNEVYKTYEIIYGATITPELAPIKEGYTFSGWSEIPETMPAHDVTVTATFTINQYKLIYMVDDKVYKTYEINYGTIIIPEPTPIKEGYTFSGWSEIPETMPDYNITVTGSFSINTYTVTYKVDGEVLKTESLTYGSTIEPPTSQREGYKIVWYAYPTTVPAYDITINGTYVVNKYKLTYMVDGEEYKTIEIEYGTAITPEDEPTKEGYTFSGWSEIPETMPAHDVTITGSFTINKYKLTYMVDGEEYKTFEVDFGTAITPETEPTKEGYTFSGWSEIPEIMPAHDVTVTGSFTINQYTITYVIDGEVYMTESVDYNSVITPPTPPEREGYDFAWGDYPETMPAHDITIEGSYTTGISFITADDEDVEWYTLNGQRIEKPGKGTYIMRKNGIARTVVVK